MMWWERILSWSLFIFFHTGNEYHTQSLHKIHILFQFFFQAYGVCETANQSPFSPLLKELHKLKPNRLEYVLNYPLSS